MKKEKKKKYDDDDGRTISNMNVPGMKWYSGTGKQSSPSGNDKKPEAPPRLTFKERLALYLGALKALLPQFLIFIAGFTIIFILLYLWLK